MPAKSRIGAIHIAHDDRDVLKPSVVTPRIDRDRPSPRREVLHQLDALVAEAHAHDAYPQSKDSLQALVVLAPHLRVRDFFKTKNVRVERDRAFDVPDRHPDGAHAPNWSG